jgi:hypothetical protein
MNNKVRKIPFISAAKTETKIPTSTKEIGNRAFFSIKSAINRMGTNTDVNKI